MATVIGLTASRMQQIEAASVVDGEVVAGNLILTKHDGTQINAGSVVGPQGPQGIQGLGPIPGEIKLWPGAALPDSVAYGKWTWANGGIFNVSDHPISAANISTAWKTAMGQTDPGVGKFRVPDLRGLVPAGLDAMPVGSARVNRMSRAVAITIAAKTGEEYHTVLVSEMPSHNHVLVEGGHDHEFAMANSPVAGGGDYPVSGSGPVYMSGSGLGRNVAIKLAITGVTAQNTGGGASHENTQPTVMVPYIVKLDG